MSSILNFIENKGIDIEKTEFYAAILGESPSKGAKSPALWNAAFQGLNLSGTMLPMDVLPDRLEGAVSVLRQDRRFIGGAVTMPYKIDILPFLDEIEPEAKIIGAVNCIYRKQNKLVGTNTDGAGALWSLKNEMEESLFGKKICLLGTGGAGFAVAAYLASEIKSSGTMILANRTPKSCEELAGKLKEKCTVHTVKWPVSPEELSGVDILVNCTSLGFETTKSDIKGAYNLRGYTALGTVDDDLRVDNGPMVEKRYCEIAGLNIQANLNRTFNTLIAMDNPVVFDIVYQPEQTMLLSLSSLLGYKILNGKAMNLEQAVIAFDKATTVAGIRKSDARQVRKLMEIVW